jgi:hypothetical protein
MIPRLLGPVQVSDAAPGVTPIAIEANADHAQQ